MKYRNPEEFKNADEKWLYMNDNNLVEVEKSDGSTYFMDADDYYLSGE